MRHTDDSPVIGANINGFNIVFDDSPDSPYAWSLENEDVSGVAKGMREEVDNRCILDCLSEAKLALDEANVPKENRWVCLPDKQFTKWSETFNTNGSLMVYTSGVNCTQEATIEDRTMSTETKLNKVSQEIEELREKLSKEARIHNGLVLQAKMNPFNDLPKNNHAFLSDAWRDHCKMTDRVVDSIRAGEATEGVNVTVTQLPDMFGTSRVSMTEELKDAVDEFEEYVFNTYAIPVMKLNREFHALKQIRDAERKLDNKDNDYLFMTCF